MIIGTVAPGYLLAKAHPEKMPVSRIQLQGESVVFKDLLHAQAASNTKRHMPISTPAVQQFIHTIGIVVNIMAASIPPAGLFSSLAQARRLHTSKALALHWNSLHIGCAPRPSPIKCSICINMGQVENKTGHFVKPPSRR